MWTLANPLVKLGLGLLLVLGVFAGGVFFEYSHTYLPYKAEVQATAQAQANVVKQLNATIDKNAKDANEQILETAKNINTYYAANPVVRVRVTHGVCTVSQTTGDTSSTDEASTTGYVSAYSPKATVEVASQLDQLMKLLRTNGVTVK